MNINQTLSTTTETCIDNSQTYYCNALVRTTETSNGFLDLIVYFAFFATIIAVVFFISKKR